MSDSDTIGIGADGMVRHKQWSALTREVIELQLARLLDAAPSPPGDD